MDGVTKPVGQMSAAELLQEYRAAVRRWINTSETECENRLLSLLESGQRAEEMEKALRWAIRYLEKFVTLPGDGSAYIRGTSTELAGFAQGLNAAREALRKEG